MQRVNFLLCRPSQHFCHIYFVNKLYAAYQISPLIPNSATMPYQKHWYELRVAHTIACVHFSHLTCTHAIQTPMVPARYWTRVYIKFMFIERA